MGPLSNDTPVADKTERHVREAVDRGASVVTGRSRAGTLGSELFFEGHDPRRRHRRDGGRAREETFGLGGAGLDDPPRAGGDRSRERLGVRAALGGVHTRPRSRPRFAEAVRTGWVNVNEGTNYWESHLPFGGRAGSASGVGRVGSRFSMDRLTELKTIVVNVG